MNDEKNEPQEPLTSEEGARVLNSKQVSNKYEAAIVAAVEARRLNDITRVTGESLSARVTQMAIDNVRHGRVQFFYDEPLAAPPSEEDEG